MLPSNIRRTLVGNEIVDHSDVVEAAPVGAAQLHLHSRLDRVWFSGLGKGNCKTRRETLKFWDSVLLRLNVFTVVLGLNMMVAILQTAFSNAFSWIKKCLIFLFKFRWRLFPRVQLTSIVSENSLSPNRRQAIIWIYVGQYIWQTHLSLDFKELKHMTHDNFGLDTSSSIHWMFRCDMHMDS